MFLVAICVCRLFRFRSRWHTQTIGSFLVFCSLCLCVSGIFRLYIIAHFTASITYQQQQKHARHHKYAHTFNSQMCIHIAVEANGQGQREHRERIRWRLLLGTVHVLSVHIQRLNCTHLNWYFDDSLSRGTSINTFQSDYISSSKWIEMNTTRRHNYVYHQYIISPLLIFCYFLPKTFVKYTTNRMSERN